jgi:hypothetical protein
MYSGALAECVPATGTRGFPGAIGVCWSSREIETRRESPPRVSRSIGFEPRTGFSRSTGVCFGNETLSFRSTSPVESVSIPFRQRQVFDR